MRNVNASEETETIYVKLESFAKKLGLKIFYDGEREEIPFNTFSVNRPGLLLAGFKEFFSENRVQVFGNLEMDYIEGMCEAKRREIMKTFFSFEIPCLILARGYTPTPEMEQFAREYKRPILLAEDVTSNVINDVIMYLNDLLAENTVMHGVLMDVHGVGVLITGKSGMGKSETALELIKRGQRLVADDAVIVKNVRNTLVGTAPEAIRFLLEVRGIGIVDIRSMYGVGAVAREVEVELVMELENWEDKKSYRRVTTEEDYEEILGKKVPKIVVPVKAGRNIAVIVEVAARNFRVKEEGLDIVSELNSRR